MEKIWICQSCKYLTVKGDTADCTAPSGQDITMDHGCVTKCSAFIKSEEEPQKKTWKNFNLGFIGSMEVEHK